MSDQPKPIPMFCPECAAPHFCGVDAAGDSCATLDRTSWLSRHYCSLCSRTWSTSYANRGVALDDRLWQFAQEVSAMVVDLKRQIAGAGAQPVLKPWSRDNWVHALRELIETKRAREQIDRARLEALRDRARRLLQANPSEETIGLCNDITALFAAMAPEKP